MNSSMSEREKLLDKIRKTLSKYGVQVVVDKQRNGFPQVIQAAIKGADGRIHTLPRPARHSDVIKKMRNEGIDDRPNEVQGFLIDNGSFFDRRAAAELALFNTQCKKLIAPPNLCSEDLW